MALPFGEDFFDLGTGLKEFSYAQEGGQMLAKGNSLQYFAVIRSEEFGFSGQDETDKSVTYKHGTGQWSWLDLTTIGNCACWGVSGDDRQRILLPGVNENQRLYDMQPHNVDFARQSLSLVLGVGTLAYAAAHYEGDEDIYANIEWHINSVWEKEDVE